MIKKITVDFMLILSLMTQCVFAGTEVKTSSLASGFDEITITVENDNTQGFISVYVYAENKTKLVFMGQQRAESKNIFSFGIKPESERFEKYTVRINRSGESEEIDFKYYTYRQQEDAIARLLSGNEITAELAEILSLDISEESLYGRLENKSSVLSEMKKNSDVTPENIGEVFTQSAVNAAFRSRNPSTLKMLAEQYKDITKLEENYKTELEWYNDTEDKAEFWNRISAVEYADADEYGKAFAAQAFLYKEADVPYSGLEAFIRSCNGKYMQNGKTLNVDFSVLNLKNRTDIDKTMYKIADTLYESIEALETAIKKAAEEVKAESGSGAGSSGGGSSSGGSVKSGSGNSGSGTSSTYIKPTTQNTGSIAFGDIANVPWAKEAILGLAERGVVNGMGAGIFEPEMLVTREQFAKMAVLAFGFKTDVGGASFADADSSAWYMPYISACNANGIMIGTGERFGIGEAVSRQDIAVVLYRILKIKGISGSAEKNNFSDAAKIADYAEEAVNFLYNKGIMNGTGDNKVSPGKFADRAETAKLIYDTLKFMGE